MLSLSTNPYVHSARTDGKINSTCARCCLTIGTSVWEAELESMEAAHICQASRTIGIGERKPVRRTTEPAIRKYD